MWMRIPGKNRWLAILGLGLALVGLAVLPVFAGAKPKDEPPAPPASPPGSEIIITGKVFASLKRRVDLPFKGLITSVAVRSGQKVEAGEILARYRLAPEALLAIQERLSPPRISEAEVKLAETERTFTSLKSKQQEITALSQRQLAPPQSLRQIDRDVQLVNQERRALRERLQRDRQLAQQDQAVLQEHLGAAVAPGHLPREAVLKAPLDGYVLRVSPDFQTGAELAPTPAVMLVGVMDPMLLLAQAFEIEALQIKEGQTAEVTLESLPGKKFEARVNRISWSSLTPGLEQPSYYEVELTVPNPHLLLKEGLKARIVFRKSGKEES